MWYVERSPLYFDLTFISSFWNFQSVLMKWMNLEPNIQSEVSQQKEKNEYHILMHIYGIQKDGTDEPICRVASNGDADTENRLMDLVQERDDEMN